MDAGNSAVAFPKASSKTCSICGAAARGINFNVMSCMSCKSFFRRNANKTSLLDACQFEKNCTINERTRSYCSPCRLQKCIMLGMDPKLIQNANIPKTTLKSNSQKKISNGKQIELPSPRPLGLLQNDRSILASSEWNLLSNILHVFDEYNPSRRITVYLNELSSLPPKLRWKPSELQTIIRDLYTSIGPLVQHSPDYSSLSKMSRQIVVQNNLYMAGVFNACLHCREVNLFRDTTISHMYVQLFGPEHLATLTRHLSRLSQNGNLLKIFTFILTFSSNCSTFRCDSRNPILTSFSSMDIFRIENIYVTMLWKYLLYLYGFEMAVRQFIRLVNDIMNTISMVKLIPTSEARDRLMDTVVVKMQNSFILDN